MIIFSQRQEQHHTAIRRPARQLGRILSGYLLLLCLLPALARATPIYSYHVTGIDGALLENVHEQLKSELPALAAPCTPHALQQRITATPAQISKALQPFGYFKAQVQTQLLQRGDTWYVNYIVVPGKPLRITQLKIALIGPGHDDVELQKFTRAFPLRAGQILQMPRYESAKQALYNMAEAQGFMAAQLTQHSVQIDLKKYTAVVTLELTTGPRFYFGPVRFSSNPFLESFLRRFMPFKEGEPYAAKKLLMLQDNLVNSDYFSQVSVQAQRAATVQNKVPTQVNLIPRKPQQYTFGLGYGTDTGGARATLGWDARRVTPTGQRFSTLMKLSPVQNSLQAIYAIPGANPSTDQYNLSSSVLSSNTDQGKSMTEQFGVAAIKTRDAWKRTLALNYQFERYQFTGEDPQHANLLIPGITWTYLRADNLIFPKHGQQFTVNLQGAEDQMLSSTSFAQAEVQNKVIMSPTKRSRLIVRGDFGYTIVKNLATLPLSQYFYAGGTQSMRGYKYQSLGPGRYLAVGSAEFQHALWGNWHAAVFYDVGNAFDHLNQNLMYATGIGLVYRSPIGPLELTVAKALNKPGQPNQIQFTMGPEFG